MHRAGHPGRLQSVQDCGSHSSGSDSALGVGQASSRATFVRLSRPRIVRLKINCESQGRSMGRVAGGSSLVVNFPPNQLSNFNLLPTQDHETGLDYLEEKQKASPASPPRSMRL